jgi:hypothetical protein
VNARGEFLKLVIKKCHINTINLFNQVGIVAVCTTLTDTF